MTKKKSIKKTKGGKSNNFNKSLKFLLGQMLKDFIKNTYSEDYLVEDINNSINWILDNFYQVEELPLLKNCDSVIVSEIINSFSDIIIWYKTHNDFTGLPVIRDSLLEKISFEKNLPEILIASYCESYNEIMESYNFLTNKTYKEYPEHINIVCTQNICASLSLYAIYLLTFITKFKNYVIKEIKNIDGNFKLIYSSKPLFQQKELDLLSEDNSNLIKDTAHLYIRFSMNINKLIKNYGKKIINISDPTTSDIGEISFTGNSFDLPFNIDVEKIFPNLEDIKIRPSNRKYGIFPDGIRFDFKNKDSGIDYIDMIETSTDISFIFKLKNHPGLMFISKNNQIDFFKKTISSSETERLSIYNSYLEPLNETLYTLSIKKDILEDNNTFLDISKNFTQEGLKINIDSKDSSRIYVKYILISLICTYIAFYNHKLCSSDFTFKTITRDKNTKSEPGKLDIFRVSHLRKLPTGYEKSEKAIAAARKAGFTNIPAGYTFVEEHKPSDVTGKKIIKL